MTFRVPKFTELYLVQKKTNKNVNKTFHFYKMLAFWPCSEISIIPLLKSIVKNWHK